MKVQETSEAWFERLYAMTEKRRARLYPQVVRDLRCPKQEFTTRWAATRLHRCMATTRARLRAAGVSYRIVRTGRWTVNGTALWRIDYEALKRQ